MSRLQPFTVRLDNDLTGEGRPDNEMNGLRWNAVCDDNQGTRTRFDAGRNIEFRGDQRTAGRNTHRAVVVGTSVGDMPARVIGDSHQWIVGRALVIVSVGDRL